MQALLLAVAPRRVAALVILRLGWPISAVTASSQMGSNVSALLAGIGEVGIALGFAAQETVANMIAPLRPVAARYGRGAAPRAGRAPRRL